MVDRKELVLMFREATSFSAIDRALETYLFYEQRDIYNAMFDARARLKFPNLLDEREKEGD